MDSRADYPGERSSHLSSSLREPNTFCPCRSLEEDSSYVEESAFDCGREFGSPRSQRRVILVFILILEDVLAQKA